MKTHTYLSTGVLYTSIQYLRFIKKGFSENLRTITDNFPKDICDPAVVVELLISCRWLEISENGKPTLTGRGEYIIGLNEPIKVFREQLKDYIQETKPQWHGLIKGGRNRIKIFLDGDTRQCFEEAKLFDSTDKETIDWWDELSSQEYDEDNRRNLLTGRIGEALSIEYEKQRIGFEPKWISLEDNSAGYDLLSSRSADDKQILNIETKTSKQIIGNAWAFISRNEWDVAVSASEYVFHFWSLGSARKLAIIHRDEMKKHMPSNNGEGEWQTTCVPYSAFLDHFVSW